jgi:hypothetical protein
VKRRHILFIALMLGAAAAAGVLAATRTVDVGRAASTPRVSDEAVAAGSAKLDRMERSLRRALERRPPKLPRVPKVSGPSSASARTDSSEVGVVYVRPAPTGVSSSSFDDDDDYEHEDGNDDEDEHEGGDD